MNCYLVVLTVGVVCGSASAVIIALSEYSKLQPTASICCSNNIYLQVIWVINGNFFLERPHKHQIEVHNKRSHIYFILIDFALEPGNDGFEDDIPQQSLAAEMNYQAFSKLDSSHQFPKTHNHSSDCQTKQKDLCIGTRLRQSRSLTSFSPHERVNLPIVQRVYEAMMWTADEDGSHSAIRDSIHSPPYQLPCQYVDYCLDLINYY